MNDMEKKFREVNKSEVDANYDKPYRVVLLERALKECDWKYDFEQDVISMEWERPMDGACVWFKHYVNRDIFDVAEVWEDENNCYEINDYKDLKAVIREWVESDEIKKEIEARRYDIRY